jgi:hypothetical protein
MDQSLRKVVVFSMEMIEHFKGEGPLNLQIHVDHNTPSPMPLRSDYPQWVL